MESGRHGRLRICCPKGCVGSNPTRGTLVNVNRKTKMRFYLSIILTLILSVGCTAQQKASRLGETVTIDTLPKDICVINSEPQIISLNIENEGDMGLTYINTEGDLVTILYGPGLIIGGTDRTGTYVFLGDLCD